MSDLIAQFVLTVPMYVEHHSLKCRNLQSALFYLSPTVVLTVIQLRYGRWRSETEYSQNYAFILSRSIVIIVIKCSWVKQAYMVRISIH